MAWAAEVETEMRRGTFVSCALAERKTLGSVCPACGHAKSLCEACSNPCRMLLANGIGNPSGSLALT